MIPGSVFDPYWFSALLCVCLVESHSLFSLPLCTWIGLYVEDRGEEGQPLSTSGGSWERRAAICDLRVIPQLSESNRIGLCQHRVNIKTSTRAQRHTPALVQITRQCHNKGLFNGFSLKVVCGSCSSVTSNSEWESALCLEAVVCSYELP